VSNLKRAWRLTGVLWVLAIMVGCGQAGSYQLTWKWKNLRPGGADCAIRSVKACSSMGVDALVVRVLRGGDLEARVIHACYDPTAGASGLGPDLAGGQVELEVRAQSPAAKTLAGPVKVSALIPASGLVRVSVTLPRPNPCADGVDNDGDGLVDRMDPPCAASGATLEGPPACADGVDNDGDGLIDTQDPDCANARGLSERKDGCE